MAAEGQSAGSSSKQRLTSAVTSGTEPFQGDRSASCTAGPAVSCEGWHVYTGVNTGWGERAAAAWGAAMGGQVHRPGHNKFCQGPTRVWVSRGNV